ncbi:MAG: hypothetical protein WBW76_16285 [Candidatus Cybelea sp.]
MQLPQPICRLLCGCASAALLTSCDSGSTTVASAVPASTNRAGSPNAHYHRGSQGEFLGCPYPTGDVWQTNISQAQIDPDSGANIQATIDGGGGSGFVASAPTTDEYINPANSSTPLVPVQPKVKWHTPYSPWPWESSFYIEPLSDAHALVLQMQDCEYYEGYSVSYNSSDVLAMYNGGMWVLNAPFARPSQGAISTASGIPLGLLAVRPEELLAGTIPHALGWNGVAHSWSQTACVSPAAQSDCTDDLPYDGPPSDTPIPYGAHIRLKASFDDSSFPTEAKIVAEALKNYGAYGYDTGCCNTIVFVNDAYGGPTWTYADASALQSITISNFDRVVAP